MATLTIYPHLSPRVIEVDSPTTNISIQELVDLIRAWEDKVIGLNYPFLIDAAGKEELGGGVRVGITATLQNAIIAFAMQGGVDSSGTVTTADTTGRVLTDSAGTFISDGILAGDTVLNVTDQSITSIQSVDSETQVTTFGLQSGSDNQFNTSDSYKIWNKVQCEISGGNLVAVDENGVTMSAFLPTAQTHVVRTSSSSATLQEMSSVQYSSFNGGITVDPVNGTDASAFPAGTPQAPIKTCAQAMVLAEERGFKKIYFLNDFSINDHTMSGYDMVGLDFRRTVLTIGSGLVWAGGSISKCKVQGTFANNSYVLIEDAEIANLNNITLNAKDCILTGTIELNNASTSNLFNCIDGVPGSGTPIIQVNDCVNLGIWGYIGGIKLTNIITVGTNISFNAPTGRLIVDSSDTVGSIIARGVGSIVGTTGGTTITQTDLLNRDVIADSVWDEATAGHITAGTTGKALTDAGAAGNPWSTPVVGNTSAGSFGELVGKKLLTIAKFLGLK